MYSGSIHYSHQSKSIYHTVRQSWPSGCQMVNDRSVNEVLVFGVAHHLSCIKYTMQKACTQNAETQRCNLSKFVSNHYTSFTCVLSDSFIGSNTGLDEWETKTIEL